jgi:hypothetical protein
MNYNIYINSNDKMSGKNNNATFQINWDDFLPRNYKYYNVTFSFQTAPGYYKDDTTNSKLYSNCEILIFDKFSFNFFINLFTPLHI